MKLFGSTIKETVEALKPKHLGEGQSQKDKFIALGRIIVTILLVFVATFCFTRQEVGSGFGIIGTIFGYWIK